MVEEHGNIAVREALKDVSGKLYFLDKMSMTLREINNHSFICVTTCVIYSLSFLILSKNLFFFIHTNYVVELKT